MNPRTDKIILGIGGASTAGKSTLAGWIASQFPERDPVILHQDDLCFPENKLPRIRDRINWETPAAIDFIKTANAISDAAKFSGLVIHEGYMAFQSNDVNRFYTHSIFMEIGKSTFLERKKNDDRWGHEPAWYIEHIWNSYLRYGKPPSGLNKLLIINADNDINKEDIIKFLT